MEYGTDTPTGACNGSGALGTGSTGSLPDSNCIFHDIETGNISQPCSTNSVNCYVDSGSYGILATNPSTNLSTNPPAQAAYSAGEGYDLATGLGSINITNLVDNWQRTNKSALFTPAVTLATSLASYTYGVPTAIIYTATVSGTGSFPTGSVAFSGSPAIGAIGAANELSISAGCEDAGNCTESTTQSYLPLATLAGGSYTITATYSPTNENYTGGSGAIGLTINKQSPTLVANNASTPFGNATVRLTAMLSFTGAGDVPTGGVNFSVNGGSVVPGACNGTTSPITCTASYPVASLAAGNYRMSVSYPGDVNYNAIGPVTAAVSVYSNPSALRFTVASPQHTMLPTIDLSAYSNNTSGPLTFSVVSGPATVQGSVATLTGAGTVELEVSQAAGTVYSLTTATTTFTVLAGSIWIADSGGGISIFDLLGNSISTRSVFGATGAGTIATPQGVAFDSSGDLWVASSAGVSEFNRYGAASTSIPLTVGGVSNPLSLAIDGDGTVWVANANGSVSAISHTGTALSPGTGYAVGAHASTSGGIAIDLSGNVWVTNNAGNTVTEMLGAAAPVAPLSTSLANHTVGGKP